MWIIAQTAGRHPAGGLRICQSTSGFGPKRVHRQQFLDGKHPLGLRRVEPPTPQQADDRQLAALRARLTKKRTAVLNGIHKILRKHNLEQSQPTKGFQTKKVRRWLAELELPALDRLEMNLLLPQWELFDDA